jgi:hypothetical protein
MNDLEKYFYNNENRLVNKWLHYFEIYERHLNSYRGKELVLVEMGVSHGGSLQMWKNYFGPGVKIYGVDIIPQCKKFEEENIKIFIGSQSDRTFLKKLLKEIPKIDILIDDGGHTMSQQIATFEELFPHIKENGIYLCEDTHTSYWLRFGGGYKRNGTFIEYSKNLVDYLHAFHTRYKSIGVNSIFKKLRVNDFTRTINSIHYYDSIVIIEKRIREIPSSKEMGIPALQNEKSKETFLDKIFEYSIAGLNAVLRFFRIRGVGWK